MEKLSGLAKYLDLSAFIGQEWREQILQKEKDRRVSAKKRGPKGHQNKIKKD